MTAKRFMYELHRACFRDNGKAMTTREVIHTLNELYEENRRLKAQLLYDGDGVCNICNHQYLVERDKYYVARCEKEHEECSTVDLLYCEDFELVRDYQ